MTDPRVLIGAHEVSCEWCRDYCERHNPKPLTEKSKSGK